MVTSEQQYERVAQPAWQGSIDAQAIAGLERDLQLEPDRADQWRRLGEFYESLAHDAGPSAAGAYRDRAVEALTRAIQLHPGCARAHYVLGTIYRARDLRLALVEYEAAAKCDPQQYAGAAAAVQDAIRQRTYRLSDITAIVLQSAEEDPRPELLEAAFYFEDSPLRSAVIHRCGSEGGQQTADCWLFASAEPDLEKDVPLAQLTVRSNGNVFLSGGELMSSRFDGAAEGRSAAAPIFSDLGVGGAGTGTAVRAALPRRLLRRAWLPLGLLAVAVIGSLFAYTSLVAPPPVSVAQGTPVPDVPGAPQTIAAAVAAAPRMAAPSAAPEEEAVDRITSSQEEEAATRADATPTISPARAQPGPSEAMPRTGTTPSGQVPAAKTAARRSEHRLAPTGARRAEEAAPATREPVAPARAAPAATPTSRSASAHESASVEAARAAPVVPRTLAADAPISRLPVRAERAGAAPVQPSEQPAAVRAPVQEPPFPLRAAQREAPPPYPPLPKAPPPGDRSATQEAPAYAVPREPTMALRVPARERAPTPVTWTTRMRGELESCGAPGFWRNDICRERVRWSYCHPNRWDSVSECTVERFASHGAPN